MAGYCVHDISLDVQCTWSNEAVSTEKSPSKAFGSILSKKVVVHVLVNQLSKNELSEHIEDGVLLSTENDSTYSSLHHELTGTRRRQKGLFDNVHKSC